MQPRRKLGEILVDLQILTPQDVERILEALKRRQRRQKFGQMACDMGLLREEHILAALAVQMSLFPGVHRLSLEQILDYLESTAASA
jgi:hypothetical protein